MRVLCLDPSMSCLGWAICESPSKEQPRGILIDCGTLEFPASKMLTETERMEQMLEALRTLMLQNISLIIREEVVGSKSARANRLLNMLKGGIMGLARGLAIKEWSYPARDTKLYVGGTKNATKEQMTEAVITRYPELEKKCLAKFRLEAVCDALALYILWYEGKNLCQQR